MSRLNCSLDFMSVSLFVSVVRGSYMSAHVLFNLLNELRKKDKMRGLQNIYLFFGKKFNKFNITGARMLYLFTI